MVRQASFYGLWRSRLDQLAGTQLSIRQSVQCACGCGVPGPRSVVCLGTGHTGGRFVTHTLRPHTRSNSSLDNYRITFQALPLSTTLASPRCRKGGTGNHHRPAFHVSFRASVASFPQVSNYLSHEFWVPLSRHASQQASGPPLDRS